MRLAILSDIHGNLPAFEAVLADLEPLRPDRVIVAGDTVIGAPESAACWQLIVDCGITALRGNHERYLLAAAAGDPAFAGGNWKPAHWTAARFDASGRAALAALPLMVGIGEGPDLIATHSAPQNDYAFIHPDSSDAELRGHFGMITAPTAVRGHYHQAFERRLPDLHLISVGSVGLPLSPTGSVNAEYALLDSNGRGWRVQQRRVPYDVSATLRAFDTSGYLEEAGPIARLFREEVATGRHHMKPFFERFRKGEMGEAGELEEGVERYLAGE